MGLISNLLTKKGTIKGRIEVRRRPPDTRFVLIAYFVEVPPGEPPPPMTGLPPDDMLASWPSGTPDSHQIPSQGDLGTAFSIELPVGHYQVLVYASPFVIESNQIVADPSTQFGFWPLPKAIEVVARETRLLKLRIELPEGLGRFGDPDPAVPLVQRIWPTLSERYGQAANLANTGHFVEAMAAYETALGSPELAALAPADSKELQLVLQIGRVRCLHDLGRAADAAALIRELSGGLVPQLRLSLADPMTRWDLFSTMAAVGAELGTAEDTPQLAAHAIEALAPFFAERGARGDHACEFSLGLVRQVARTLWRRQEPRLLLQVLVAAQEAAQRAGGAPVTILVTAFKLECLLRGGARDDARALVEHVARELSREQLGLLASVARVEQLSLAWELLRPWSDAAPAPATPPPPGTRVVQPDPAPVAGDAASDPILVRLAWILRQLRPDLELQPTGPDRLLLRTPRAQLDITVAPLRRLASASQADYEEYARAQLKQIETLERSPERDVSRLCLSLRRSDQLDQVRDMLRLDSGDPQVDAARWPLAGAIEITLLDHLSDDMIQSVSTQDLAALGLAPPQAMAAARANTEQRLCQAQREPMHSEWATHGLFASSLLLFPERWGEHPGLRPGPLWVVPVNRDIVLSGDGGRTGTVERLLAAAERLSAQVTLPLPPQLFRWTREGFVWAAN